MRLIWIAALFLSACSTFESLDSVDRSTKADIGDVGTNSDLKLDTQISADVAVDGMEADVSGDMPADVSSDMLAADMIDMPNDMPINPALQKCVVYCDFVYGENCVQNQCELVDGEVQRLALFETCTGEGSESCISRYASDSDFKGIVDGASPNQCEGAEVQIERCKAFGFGACGCPTAQYSVGCMVEADCQAGIFTAECLPHPNMSQQRYCRISGCFRGGLPDDESAIGDLTGCAPGDACVLDPPQGTICRKTCVTGDDCAAGENCLGPGVCK